MMEVQDEKASGSARRPRGGRPNLQTPTRHVQRPDPTTQARVVAADIQQAVDTLISLDKSEFVRLAAHIQEKLRQVQDTMLGEDHPLAASAGLFRDLPGWEDDKSLMAALRTV